MGVKQLQIDRGWKGLTRPGDADDHFAVAVPPFRPAAEAFHLANAFWLSELSRLIYRRNPTEIRTPIEGPSRNAILARVQLRETLFLSRRETQCALVRTVPGHRDPFAVLVFRGTTGIRNWFLDLDVRPAPIAPRTVVHRGFVDALNAVWEDLRPHLECLYEPIFMTGHSMGGALAQLAAWHRPPRAVYSFGAPRVGDAGFVDRMKGVPIYRVVNGRDVVADLPPSSRLLSFRSAGRLVLIDRRGRICEVAQNGDAVNCFESGRLSMAALMERWYHPPGFLTDHAPINYSAQIEKSLRRGALPVGEISENPAAENTNGLKTSDRPRR